MKSSVLEVQNIYKSYGNKNNNIEVLKDISFFIHEKDFVSIMGPSGCGKSTLLYILGALDTPNRGKVFFRGKDIFLMKDKEQSLLRHERIGFVFQFYNLIPNMTVKENITLPLEMKGIKKNEYIEELESILEIIEMTDKQNEYPNNLSGGQQQRVAIARAVIGQPDIILADEPIGNLDSKMGDEIMQLFKKINEEKKIAIVQVTHSEHSASFGKRILYMKDGRIEKQVATDEIS